MKRFIYFILFMALSLGANSSNAQKTDPVETINHLIKVIKSDIVGDEAMKAKVPSDMSSFKALRTQNEKVHPSLAVFIDFQKIGEGAMPEKWQQKYWSLQAKDKKSFLVLLQKLIEEIVYPKAKDFFNKYSIQLKSKKIDSNSKKAQLFYDIEFKKSSGEIEKFPLEFRLVDLGASWKIEDIRIDDQLWTDMFKNQFNHIITTKSYSELVKKMETKLKNVQEGASF